MLGKQTTVKILVYAMKARLCYFCFQVKKSKSHKDYNSHMTTADDNTHKQNSQCMNTVLQNMNGN